MKTNQSIIQNSAPSCVLNGSEQCTVPVSLRGVPSSAQDLVCSEGWNSVLYL